MFGMFSYLRPFLLGIDNEYIATTGMLNMLFVCQAYLPIYTPRCRLVANAGGRAFCHDLGIGWVHIGQWIFSISALSHELF